MGHLYHGYVKKPEGTSFSRPTELPLWPHLGFTAALGQASNNVSQVELRHVLQRLQSLGPQKQVPGRRDAGTTGHGEVSRILSDFDRTQEIWTYFRNMNH